MISYNTINIEELVKQNEKLRVEKKRVEDKKNEANSRLETQISKHETKIKALRDKAFRNDYKAQNKFAQINRLIEENEGQIRVKAGLDNKIARKTAPKTTSRKK